MLRRLLLLCLASWTFCSAASAEEAFLRVRLSEMMFSEGAVPNDQATEPAWRMRQRILQTPAEAQLDNDV